MGHDTDIVSRALEGDTSATARICTAYAPRLRAYFRKHGLGRDEADDALQDTWTRMLDALARKRIRKDSFEGWLFATARNVCVDVIRQAQRARQRGTEDVSTVRVETESSTPGRSEIIAAIENAVAELPELLQRPLVLRHREALSYRDIAERLGISTNAVGVRIHRARQILQRELADYL